MNNKNRNRFSFSVGRVGLQRGDAYFAVVFFQKRSGAGLYSGTGGYDIL